MSTFALQARAVNKRFGAIAAAQDLNVAVPLLPMFVIFLQIPPRAVKTSTTFTLF